MPNVIQLNTGKIETVFDLEDLLLAIVEAFANHIGSTLLITESNTNAGISKN